MTLCDRLDALRVPYKLGAPPDGKLRLKKGVAVPEWLARLAAEMPYNVADIACAQLKGVEVVCCDACLGTVRSAHRLDLPETKLHWWCAPPSFYADRSREKKLTRVVQLSTLYAGLFEAAERGEVKRLEPGGYLTDARRVVARVRRRLAAIHGGPTGGWDELARLEDELREFASWEPWSGKTGSLE